MIYLAEGGLVAAVVLGAGAEGLPRHRCRPSMNHLQWWYRHCPYHKCTKMDQNKYILADLEIKISTFYTNFWPKNHIKTFYAIKLRQKYYHKLQKVCKRFERQEDKDI